MTRSVQFLCSSFAAVALFAGCASTPPQPPIQVKEGPRVVTMNIDSREYNEVAKFLYESLAQSGRIKKDGVVALGPVSEATDRGYPFDSRRLQEKLQVVALRGGLFNFSFAVDAMGGADAASERFKVMQLQWEKESTVDPEEMRTFGTLAKIDYLLFGRLSSQTTSKGGATEVTYTYNWKLGDCEKGLLVWADEFELTKTNLRRN